MAGAREQFASVASFNLIAIPGPACHAAEIPHVHKLVLYTVLPLVVAALLALPGLLALCGGWRPLHMAEKEWKEQVWDVVVRPVVVWLFVVYPMVTYQTISQFLCQDVGIGVRLLTANYEVGRPVMLILRHVIFVILLTLIILHRNPKSGLRVDRTVTCAGGVSGQQHRFVPLPLGPPFLGPLQRRYAPSQLDGILFQCRGSRVCWC
jgi:hypothetical protein